MRKVLLVVISLVLTLTAVGLLALSIAGGVQAPPAPTVQTTCATTAPETVATEPTQLPTEPPTQPPTEPIPEPPEMDGTTARHIFVYDVDAQRLLFTMGDQNERIEPASLTKLFTAYVAMQYLDPSQIVTVGEEAAWIGEGSSVAAVSEGCRLSVGLILQGMLMQSGNDAAYALAVAAGRAITQLPALDAKSACQAFIDEMNAQAQTLGLENTHFITPDGYHAEDHYTTATELMQIALLAAQDPLIMESCGLASAVVRFESGQEYTWKNTNWMLHEDSEFYCPEATGLKTGATSQAGKCLISTFRTEKTTLLIGVLGCEELDQRFVDTLLLFDHYR